MPQNSISTWLDLAIQQIATESYLDNVDIADEAAVRLALIRGNNRSGFDPPTGELNGMSRLTNVLADRFLASYKIIDHHASDATGFSATLMRERDLNGQLTNNFTLSFRSVEYQYQVNGGDWERDGLPGAAGEIAGAGFAFAQLVSMERYWRDIKASLPVDAVVNITGYSLGGHLATVFTELHAGEVNHTYTFNGAGRGHLTGGTAGLAEPDRIREMLQFVEGQLLENDPTGDIFRSGNTGNIYSQQWYQGVRGQTVFQYHPTNSFLPPGEVGSGAGFDKITQLVGQATHNDQPYVVNSGVHATPTSIFIEDQPNVDGFGGLFHQSGSFGTTHSMTLLVDSLALMEVFQHIDGNLQRETIESILAASSGSAASGFVGLSGIAEGNSLENALDALRRVYSGTITPTPFGRQTNDFGNLTFRNQFYTNLEELRERVPPNSAQIINLVGKPASDIFAQAKTNIAYRYALKELAPVVVVPTDLGHMEQVYAAHNPDQHGQGGPLDLYEAPTGLGTWTLVALSDRAELLGKRLGFNVNDGLVSVPSNLAEPTHYLDMTTGFEIGTTLPQTNDVVFGTTQDDRALEGRSKDDHLYGGGGDDVLRGFGGRDYLEGNTGDDEIYGGTDDDILLGQQGRDHLDGGSGADRMSGGSDNDIYIADHTGDTVTEFENGGTDEVYASTDFVLGSQVENLTLTGAGGTSGTGNDLDNHMRGNNGNNRLAGKGGIDLLEGGIGFDTYVYNAGDGLDRIEDSDAQGQILFDGRLLQGGIRKAGDAANTYVSLDGRNTYVLSNSDLIVDGTLIVNENFESGQLGIRLFDMSSSPTGQQPNVIYDRTISGSSADEFVNDGLTNISNDQVFGLGGRDVVQSGGGEDALFGGDGDDLLIDVLYGAGENDYLDGGIGNDYLAAGIGDDIALGGEGDDTLLGSSYDSASLDTTGRDYLDGGSGNDYLWGDASDDTLLGGSGDDTLRGDNLPGDAATPVTTTSGWTLVAPPSPTAVVMNATGGADFLDGGTGNDFLQGDAGDDILIGGLGADRLYGDNQDEFVINEGDDWLDGGAGDDQLFAAGGNDSLSGGIGIDQLYGDQGDDILDGGEDADTIVGGDGRDVLFGGSGNDRLFGEGLNNPFEATTAGDADFLDGGEGDDELQGGVGDDSLFGSAGADRLFGQEGNDSLLGDEGDDELQGGIGEDVLYGDAGNDLIFGQEDHDVLSGDDGNDLLNGGAGNDEVDGGEGEDQLVGDAGNDQLYGGAGNDALFGEAGTDLLDGGDGHDVFQGGGGDDQLLGGAGDDVLFGELASDGITAAGDDLLQGGTGNDSLRGGGGRDTYLFNPGDGADVIFDASGEGNRLVFGAGIRSTDITIGIGAADSLIVRSTNTGDVIQIVSFGTGNFAGAHPIDTFEFADGTVLTYSQLAARGFDLLGTAANDTIAGTDMTDRIFGGIGHDQLSGLGGDDTLSGQEGDDFLRGGVGDDVLDGGNGHDLVFGDQGMDQLIGGVGNDSLFGGEGDDVLQGGSGNDQLDGEGGADQLFGGDGDDVIVIDPDDTVVDGGAGSDTISFRGFSGVTYDLGASHFEQAQGTEGNDTFVAASVSDPVQLFGQSGDDTLVGGFGHDFLAGGEGADTLAGGAGDDTLDGDLGEDTYLFKLGDGQDTINDLVVRESFDDDGNIVTLMENNRVIFGAGITPDAIRPHIDLALFSSPGSTGTLLLSVGATDSLAFANFDPSNLLDHHAIETFQFDDGSSLTYNQLLDRGFDITGTSGDDTIRGTSADDRLDGGAGNDELRGGEGNDTYLFGRGSGQDVVIDQRGTLDTVRFAAGIVPADVTVARNSHDLVLGIAGTADRLTLSFFFLTPALQVEQVRFANGTVWDAAYLRSRTEEAIQGTDGADVQQGTAGDDVIAGLGGDDRLVGLVGHDVLDGGPGADTIEGGLGDDTYVVDDVGDVVTEQANEGIDTIRSSVSRSLEAHVENLILTGTAAINGTGNELDNVLTGNNAANVLDGAMGNDTYVIGAGDTVIEQANGGIDTIVTDQSYTLNTHIENLTLTGTAAVDGTGNNLDNILAGNSAANVLIGGAGNDTYVIDASDTVVEASSEGRDTVVADHSYTLGANVENVTLTGNRSINATGNELDNVLRGNSSVNVLKGGLGDDMYVVGVGDLVVESTGEGIDTVQAAHSYTLGANVENLTLLEPHPALAVNLTSGTSETAEAGLSANFTGTGNSLDNVLVGNRAGNTLYGYGGDDWLDGGGGNDILAGGEGADTYVFGLGSGHDFIDDQDINGEIDTIRLAPGLLPNQIGVVQTANHLVLRMPGSRDSLTLANFFGSTASAKKIVQFEDGTVWDEMTLRTLGADPGPGIFFTDPGGSPADNVFSGTVGHDEIRGTSGNDIIAGGAGHDILRDNSGNNVLDGGSGDDSLFGGSGNDTFVFSRGYGHDTVVVDHIFFGQPLGFTWSDLLTTDTDTIQMVGLGASDVAIQRQSSGAGQLSFTITVLDTADQLTLLFRNGIYGFAPAPVTLDFADGTTVDLGLFSAFPEAPLPAVFSSVDYTLSAAQEHLVLLDVNSSVVPSPRIGTGNALDNVIVGNTADNIMNGGAGNDVLIGGFARSVEGFFFIDTGSDVLLGGEGDDLLIPFGDETFAFDFGIGGHPNPFNTPDDVLLGGPGNDAYVIRHAGQIVGELEGEGTDTVRIGLTYHLGDHVENLTLTGLESLTGTGNELDNVLIGNGGDNVLIGGSGDDTLSGGTGFDFDFDVVRSGNDTFIGGTGNDTYVFALGDAQDTIEDTAVAGGGGNRILFGAGISQSDLTLTEDQASRTLTITVGAGGDTLSLNNFDSTGANGSTVVETVAFADGDEMSLASLFRPAITDGDDVITTGAGDQTIEALGGNDVVDTGAGNDTLIGGVGNDQLTGGPGDDTYVFNLGDGTDQINDTVAPGEGNTLVFGPGITSDDLNLGLGSLVIRVGTSGDAIRMPVFDLENAYGSHAIETFRFADGTTLSYSQLIDRGFDLFGTAGDDTITGTNAVDRVTGLAGSDMIQTAQGDDVLDGGLGADTLMGGNGNDTYVVDDPGDLVIEGANEGFDRVQTSVSHALSVNVEELMLRGSAAIDGLGNGLDNVLTGNSSANLIDGAAGADLLVGGDGDDTYVIDNVGDNVAEQANEGVDTVLSAVSYILGANLDNLTLTGTDAIDGAGNASDNILLGNLAANNLNGGDGHDLLDGGSGADRLFGETGNDTYIVEDLGDVVSEMANEGVDTVQSSVTYTLEADVENLTLVGASNLNGAGNILSNILTGNSGNNVLDGGVGADTMTGGAGDDTYLVDNIGDEVSEQASGGLDTVRSSVTYTLGANVENLTLADTTAMNGTGNPLDNGLIGNGGANILDAGAGNDTLSGGAGNDTLRGGAGDDGLDGGTGTDTMTGGTGNDMYVVDATNDVVTELANEGVDTVQSGVAHTLGTNVENLTLTGIANINGMGNALDNILIGNGGLNILTGGAGNDLYVVGAGDTVVEYANVGTDTVQSSVTWTLGSHVENVTLTGMANINGTGNALNNVMAGNSGANTLDGGSGNDLIDGHEGNDSLHGGSGDDSIVGGVGNDTLSAGSGHDVLEGGEGADILEAGSGNDQLQGGAGTDTLLGGSGSDRLTGGTGNDLLQGGSGNDVYVFSRGDGQDTVVEADPTPFNSDSILFGADVNPLDLVLSRQANDLRVAIHGSSDQMTVQNWFSGGSNQIESMQAGNGQNLVNTKVDQLLQAMAAFTQQSGMTWDQAIDQRPQDVQNVLAANWQ